MTKSAIYAGSFDPMTLGHAEIIEKALTVFDKIFVLVAFNPFKKHFLSIEDRLALAKGSVELYPQMKDRVEVLALKNFDTVAHQAKILGVSHLIRGLRGHTDIENEMDSARVNKEINSNLETLLFVPEIYRESLSSSFVRGVLGFRGWRELLANKVAPCVIEKMQDLHFQTLMGANDRLFGNLKKHLNRNAYHNINHSYNLLSQVIYDIDSEKEKKAVAVAAAYHDYEQSLNACVDVMLLDCCDYRFQPMVFSDKETADRTSALIYATDHSKPLTEDQLKDIVLCRFVAADLSILSSDQKTYADYVMSVRKEYDCTDEEWKVGRLKFLQSMLQPHRNSIFPNLLEFSEMESRALFNIQKEIEQLKNL